MFVFQPKTISTVTFLLATVFATRCIFNFLTLSGLLQVTIGSGNTTNNVIVVAAYGVWEFFPLILLLTTVASGECNDDNSNDDERRSTFPARTTCGALSSSHPLLRI